MTRLIEVTHLWALADAIKDIAKEHMDVPVEQEPALTIVNHTTGYTIIVSSRS